MRNSTELQQRLIALGFPVGLKGADGIFGADSLAAYNRFLASKGKPPHVGMILLAELNAELFPEEQPIPIPRKPGPLAILSLIFDLSKGKSMKFSTIEQLIRIVGYTGGAYVFGDAVANGQTFQAAIGGVVAIGAFVWWLVFERNRIAK